MSIPSFQELKRRARAEALEEQGKKLRGLYRQLGYEREDFANFLQVSTRTLYYWERGRSRIPVAVIKLLRLLTWSELPGKSWDGWHFSAGKLWSPEGHGFDGTESSWWSSTMRRAAMFGVLYRERSALRAQLLQARQQLADAETRALQAEGRAGLVELAFIGAIAPDTSSSSAEVATALAAGKQSAAGQPVAHPVKTLGAGRDDLVTRPVCAIGGTFDDAPAAVQPVTLRLPSAPRFVFDLSHVAGPRYRLEPAGSAS